MNSSRSAVHDDDMALDLAGLIRALGRAMRWLVPLVICVAIGTLLVLQVVPSKYKGEARVLIESKGSDYPGASRGIEEERALLDSEGVASQVQLLMSADLARRVAKRLDLVSVPEFEAGARDGLISDALVMFGLARDPARISPEERALKVFYKNLDIYRLEDSRVIAVEFSSEDPELAAAVANTIVDEYIALQSSAKRETTAFASSSLEPQIERLKAEVQSARKAVEDFRARADLFIGTDNLTLNQQQLAEISSSYSQAQATKAEAQAKADLIRGLLESGGSLETASDVLDSLLIQRLRERQVAIQSNIAELSITLLPNHPQLKALQSQLSDYNRQIRNEARKVLAGLENDAKVAAQQADALKNRLAELKQDSAKTNADQVRLAELEREANAKGRQLDELISSFRDADTRLRAQVLPADARIISRASIPIEPYAPKVAAITIIAALATFVLGCAFVIMREFLNGNALYSVAYPSGVYPQPRQAPEPAFHGSGSSPAAETWGANGGVAVNGGYSYGSYGDYRDVASRYVQGVAGVANGAEEEALAKSQPDARNRSTTSGTGTISPDRIEQMDAAVAAGLGKRAVVQDAMADADEDWVASSEADDGDLDGVIVVLTVDDAALSHERAFHLARRAANEGKASVLTEVFPEIESLNAAPGFAELVTDQAVFSKVVYQDAASSAHIIESGAGRIEDRDALSDRFDLVLDAIETTYDTVVIDLGVIDGSSASANILKRANRVLMMSAEASFGHELKSAARLLALNSGADVEVITAQETSGDRKKAGKVKRRGRVA